AQARGCPLLARSARVRLTVGDSHLATGRPNRRTPMRRALPCLLLACLAPPAPAPTADAGPPAPGVDYRVVFRYRAQAPGGGSDYESEVRVFERLPDGGEKRVGQFTGSIFPDDLKVRGRVKDGRYDLYLGLHRRSRDGKALTPTPADLVVKREGWLRPA